MLVCDDGQGRIHPLKFDVTTDNPPVPTTVAGTALTNGYREVKRIGSTIYAINSSNQLFELSITSASTPAISIASNSANRSE